MTKPRKRIAQFIAAHEALGALEGACGEAGNAKYQLAISRIMDVLERMERELVKAYEGGRVRR